MNASSKVRNNLIKILTQGVIIIINPRNITYVWEPVKCSSTCSANSLEFLNPFLLQTGHSFKNREGKFFNLASIWDEYICQPNIPLINYNGLHFAACTIKFQCSCSPLSPVPRPRGWRSFHYSRWRPTAFFSLHWQRSMSSSSYLTSD